MPYKTRNIFFPVKYLYIFHKVPCLVGFDTVSLSCATHIRVVFRFLLFHKNRMNTFEYKENIPKIYWISKSKGKGNKIRNKLYFFRCVCVCVFCAISSTFIFWSCFIPSGCSEMPQLFFTYFYVNVFDITLKELYILCDVKHGMC